jgi:hypothetical protein
MSDPVPAASDAARASKPREEKLTRTQDDARMIEAGGKAYEMGGSTVRLGLDAATGAVERLAVQVKVDAKFVGKLQKKIAKLERKLGKYRRKEKGKEATEHAIDVRGEVDKLRITETSAALQKLSDHALPVLLPELLPFVRRAGQYLDKILPAVTATAARVDGDARTPKAAAMRLFAKLYAPPDALDDDGVSFGKQVLKLLERLAGEEDWPLVQEYLVLMMVPPPAAEPVAAQH